MELEELQARIQSLEEELVLKHFLIKEYEVNREL